MPAPASITYSAAALVAASNALLSAIDAGTGPGQIKIWTEADVQLSAFSLTEPAGTVDGAGALTLTASSADDAEQTDIAAWAAVYPGSSATPLITMPVIEGEAPVSGYLVLSTLNLVAGEPVTIVSAVIG